MPRCAYLCSEVSGEGNDPEVDGPKRQEYMNREMKEQGIVARDCLPSEPRSLLPAAARHHRGQAKSLCGTLPASEAVVPRQRAAGLRRETNAGNNPFLLNVKVQSTSD
ncbi:unnamed protein product [Boreogadus saida]